MGKTDCFLKPCSGFIKKDKAPTDVYIRLVKTVINFFLIVSHNTMGESHFLDKY